MEERAARAERLQFARRLRNDLFDRLSAQHLADPGRPEPFLDTRGGLAAGGIWQQSLHSELHSCVGGVVLLTPESVVSGWVLKEATILSWRVFLGQDIVLVPIVLGVSDGDLSARGFSPLALDRIQWVKLADSNDAELERAVEETVGALARIPDDAVVRNELSSPTAWWIKRLAGLLDESTPPRLRDDSLVEMCRALKISPDDRARFGEDPYLGIASEVLVASGDQVVRAISRAGNPSREQRERLKEAVTALWVDPMPANRVLLAATRGEVIAVDATEQSQIRDYVLRAHCDRIDANQIIVPDDVTDGTDAAVIDEVERSLSDMIDIDDKDALAAEIAEYGPYFVLLGSGAARPSVLDALTSTYPGLTFVVAAGPQPERTLNSWFDRVVVLQPRIHPDRIRSATRFHNKLVGFVSGRNANDRDLN